MFSPKDLKQAKMKRGNDPERNEKLKTWFNYKISKIKGAERRDNKNWNSMALEH